MGDDGDLLVHRFNWDDSEVLAGRCVKNGVGVFDKPGFFGIGNALSENNVIFNFKVLG